jgi:hypothetical protein
MSRHRKTAPENLTKLVLYLYRILKERKSINVRKSNNKKTRSLLSKGSVGTIRTRPTVPTAKHQNVRTVPTADSAVSTAQCETIYGTGAMKPFQ